VKVKQRTFNHKNFNLFCVLYKSTNLNKKKQYCIVRKSFFFNFYLGVVFFHWLNRQVVNACTLCGEDIESNVRSAKCDAVLRIYYTFSKTRLAENVFPLTLALTLFLTLTLTLNHHNGFGLTKLRHFSRNCTLYRYPVLHLQTSAIAK